VDFTEGSFVSKGKLLYRIDPKPLEAALAREQADLATGKARLEKADNDVRRLTPLAAQQAVSQQELDDSIASQQAARAQVDAAEAAVDKAALDLSYTRVTSPIDGLVGTTLVKAGSLVGRGESTLLTTVSQIDPILFRAGISEADYLRLVKQRPRGDTARPAQAPPMELVLADGTTHPHLGTVDAVERAVDATTGTLSVQTRFANPERVLRPGQYGRVRVQAELKQGALLVPQRAVTELQNLHSVAILTEGNKIAFRNVEVGPRVDGLWVIEKGLEPGQRVVVEGLQRVREGLVVNPQPAPAEGAETSSESGATR
jgi:membrane fusion protein (multidrug efflux system)